MKPPFASNINMGWACAAIFRNVASSLNSFWTAFSIDDSCHVLIPMTTAATPAKAKATSIARNILMPKP